MSDCRWKGSSIEFISKTLTKAEKRWSAYEKEAFAIFYSLRKWETHLRDVKFTLFTDHRNLTFMNKDPNAKVLRLKLAVQDYNFDIAYIPGEKNIIADGVSRLCARDLPEEHEPVVASIAALRIALDRQEYEEPTWIPDFEERERESYYFTDTLRVMSVTLMRLKQQVLNRTDLSFHQRPTV